MTASGATSAALWGGMAGASLLMGALLGLYARASRQLIGLVMALGSGVLVSAVAFELMAESYHTAGFTAASGGLLAGALVYFAADLYISRRGAKHRKRSTNQPADKNSGTMIAVGALLDGIPESVAIGASLLGGQSASWAMVMAVFLSNIPESMSSAAGMHKAGRSTRFILGLWTGVVAVSALCSCFGYVGLAHANANVIAAIQAFAAGAVLTMLASTMMPEAHEEGGALTGVVTAIGFLLSFMLSHIK